MPKAFYYFYIIPLLLSAISSLRAFRLKWPKPYRGLSIFLFVTFFVELLAILWKDYLNLHKTPWWDFNKNNLWLYNFYFLPQYLFYLFFFYSVIEIRAVQKAVIAVAPLYIVFWAGNIMLIQGIFNPNNYTLVFGCLMVLWLVVSYFYKLLVQSKLIILKKEPLVWVSCGAFLFHIGCLPYFIWFNELVKSSTEKAYVFLIVVVVLNTIMYSLYSIAFLWKRPF